MNMQFDQIEKQNTVKGPVNTAADHGSHNDIKNIEIQLRELKISVNKKVEMFRDEVKDRFDQNSTEALEKKLIERINDVVILMTRQMADKQETKRDIKLIERQLKHIFNISLSSLKFTGQITQAMISEALQYKLYQQTELIASYICAEFAQSASLDWDMIVIGEEMHLSPFSKRLNPAQYKKTCLAAKDLDNSKEYQFMNKRLSQDDKDEKAGHKVNINGLNGEIQAHDRWQQSAINHQNFPLPQNKLQVVTIQRGVNNISSSTQQSNNVIETYDVRTPQATIKP